MEQPQMNMFSTARKGRSKYGNRKTAGYDSRRECRRAAELRLLERAGEITDLQEQVPFELIPPQYDSSGDKPRLVERACRYVADFTYRDAITGQQTVEDAKGMRTEVYKIKRKLMLYIHGIRIKET